jgi:hypothetical protein
MSFEAVFGGDHHDNGPAECTYMPPLQGLLPESRTVLPDSNSLIPLQNGFAGINLLAKTASDVTPLTQQEIPKQNGPDCTKKKKIPVTSSCYYCKKNIV